MINSTKQFFDDFTLYARVLPVLVHSLPAFILLLLNRFLTMNWIANSIMLTIVIVLLSVTSKISRNLGKDIENKLFNKIGGKPSTIILRFSDKTLNETTKINYHKKINNTFNLNLPLQKEDENKADDDKYAAASTALKNRANSNRKDEYRVYQELKEYHFWRNFYGSKYIVIGIYSLIGIREFLLIESFSLKAMFIQPHPQYTPFIILLVYLAFIIAFVRLDIVKNRAFDYARTLIETCERL